MSQKFHHGYALIIGVGRDLPNTVRDASAIANLLADPTRCAYPPEQVKLLLNENATKSRILSELDWLAKSATPESTVLLYFSGHGVIASDYYLLPFDGHTTQLPNTGISISEFSTSLRAMPTHRLVVLLDLHHSGPKNESKEYVDLHSQPSLTNFIAKATGGVLFISSRINEIPMEGTPYNIFTNTLLEALAGYGTFEEDGYVRAIDMALYIGRQVPQRTLGKQHPIVRVSKLSDNFPVSLYAAGSRTPRSLPWIVSTSSHVTNLEDTESINWMRRLVNYRQNLLLIEERMSQYVNSLDIPLQLVRNKQQTEDRITELEQKLGISVLVEN